MGKFAKTVGYTFIGLVTLSVLTQMLPSDKAEPVKEVKPAAVEQKKEEPKQQANPSPDRPKGDKGVTEDNFNKIVQGDMFGEGGMSKKEVFDMLGNANTFTTSKMNDMEIDTASWNTDDYKIVIMIQFHNGKVSSKTITKL